jgi:hypothetical protein
MIPLAGGQTVGTVPGWQNPKLLGVGPAGLTSGLKPHAVTAKRTFPDLSRFIPGSISVKVSIISVVLDSCEIIVGLLIGTGTGVLNKLWDVTSAGRLTGLIKFLTNCIINLRHVGSFEGRYCGVKDGLLEGLRTSSDLDDTKN